MQMKYHGMKNAIAKDIQVEINSSDAKEMAYNDFSELSIEEQITLLVEGNPLYKVFFAEESISPNYLTPNSILTIHAFYEATLIAQGSLEDFSADGSISFSI